MEYQFAEARFHPAVKKIYLLFYDASEKFCMVMAKVWMHSPICLILQVIKFSIVCKYSNFKLCTFLICSETINFLMVGHDMGLFASYDILNR